MIVLSAFLIFCLLFLVSSWKPPATYSDDKLNVHIVSHTHNDLGWLKTVDQYFYGANNSIQHAGVNYILDSVMTSLEEDEGRCFTYVEQGFFWRWWNRQSVASKNRVRKLVRRNQLEFVNGGWVMQDEASTHYVSMIDQTTLGHSFLLHELGVVPRVGWQIDPFGHSSTQSALLSAEVGFDALYFGRIDYQDREVRIAEKRTEMVWRASPSLGLKSGVFTGVFQSGNYGPPSGFCYDQFCEDPPIQDDPLLEDYNVQERVDTFVQECEELAIHTEGNHIMLQMGSDFQYENANVWFKNLDKLIQYTNEDGRVNVFYSNPTTYTKAKHEEKLTWPLKTDDFFPYADCSHCMWTGYFTSRSTLKRFERESSGFLQTSRAMDAIAGTHLNSRLLRYKGAQGVFQHHDGVSGTSKQHVAYDYVKMLTNGVAEAEDLVNRGLIHSSLLHSTTTEAKDELSSLNLPPLQRLENEDIVGVMNEVDWDAKLSPEWIETCNRNVNESVCSMTFDIDEGRFGVIAFNPLPRKESRMIDIPISTRFALVHDDEGNVLSDQYQVSESPPSTSDEAQPYILSIQLGDIGALQSQRVVVTLLPEGKNARQNEDDLNYQIALDHLATIQSQQELQTIQSSSITIDSSCASVSVSLLTGRISSIGNGNENLDVPLNQGFCYYKGYGSPGNEAVTDGQNDGAYIFRPDEPDAVPEMISSSSSESTSTPITSSQRCGVGDAKIVKVQRGKLYSEVWQEFEDWMVQIVRVRNGGDCFVEFDWTIGPVPIDDHVGKEVVSVFNAPSIRMNNTWYTDSNGREYIERIRDYRATWDYQVNQPVSGNYYPVNAGMYVKDRNQQLSILVDRSQGGGSVQDTSLELMIQRRLLVDDSRGVGEPLNETDSGITPYPDWDRWGDGLVVRGSHYVLVSTPETAMSQVRSKMDKIFAKPSVSLLAPPLGPALVSRSPSPIPALSVDLPENLNLMTLEEISANTLLVRISHQFAKGEDSSLSQPASVDLCSLFSFVTSVEDVVELSLTTNQRKDEMKRMYFRSDGETLKEDDRELVIKEDGYLYPTTTRSGDGYRKEDDMLCEVELDSMEIRTFMIQFMRSD